MPRRIQIGFGRFIGLKCMGLNLASQGKQALPRQGEWGSLNPEDDYEEKIID